MDFSVTADARPNGPPAHNGFMATVEAVGPVERKKTREVAGRSILIVLAGIAALLLALIVWPFWKAILIAAVLAAALHPFYERLAARLGKRRHITAILFTLAVVIVIVVPTMLLTIHLGREAIQTFAYVQDTLKSEGVAGLVEDLPSRIRPLGHRILEAIPPRQQQELSRTSAPQAAAAVGGLIQATSNALVQAGIMLIAFFFLLTDSERLVAWLIENAPLPRSHTRGLLTEFRQVSVSVLVSSTATAAAQAAAAGIGYLVAGAPSPLFFTSVTFLTAFVPAVGGGGTTFAVACFIFLTGRVGAAIFLAVWAILVVGLVDNALRPILIKGDVQIHGALLFFALLGGLTYFGAVGLLAGPLILVFFLAVVRMCRREYQPDES